jgi:two-component system cell cycle sensor histidine kinase/response regulator CckA
MTDAPKDPLGELIASAAHEINNPLAGIIGYAQLAAVERDPQRVRELLSIIGDQAQACRQTVMKLEACFVLRPPTLALALVRDLIDTTLAYQAMALDSANVEVSQSIDGNGDLAAAMDLDLMRIALGKLIENSREALAGIDTPRTLALVARRNGQYVELDVIDNGPGIATAHRNQLFEPTLTTHTTGRGLGLGLTTARRIAQAHRGNVIMLDPAAGAAVQLRIPALE